MLSATFGEFPEAIKPFTVYWKVSDLFADEALDFSSLKHFWAHPPLRESAFVLFWTNSEGIYDISKIEEMGASVMISHLWTDAETISQEKRQRFHWISTECYTLETEGSTASRRSEQTTRKLNLNNFWTKQSRLGLGVPLILFMREACMSRIASTNFLKLSRKTRSRLIFQR